ncbi:MAG: VOC family protein [Anaerolineae bacterium]|nr:VOC family protein [Anaerolineales bacterium]MCQ3973735.1 VOC family protein [Anaerolineae bacterium]
MQKITAHLWFDNQAEEAMKFYTSVFKDSKIIGIQRYPDESLDEHFKGMAGKVIHGVFELAGQRFMALDGGPMFKFNEAISLYVECESQVEVDYFWEKLTADGGEESMCGWLKDKYGLSWQIVPKQLGELMSDQDTEKTGRVTQALMQMKKIDIARLRQAYEQA